VELSPRQQKVLWVSIAVILLAAIGWSVAAAFKGGGGNREMDMELSVLCSGCKYQGSIPMTELKAHGQPSMAPMFGPGYVCPSCKKTTLYANPIVCKKCKTPFLLSPGPSGSAVAKCPKCGWTR
jgi:hypothetical protein